MPFLAKASAKELASLNTCLQWKLWSWPMRCIISFTKGLQGWVPLHPLFNSPIATSESLSIKTFEKPLPLAINLNPMQNFTKLILNYGAAPQSHWIANKKLTMTIPKHDPHKHLFSLPGYKSSGHMTIVTSPYKPEIETTTYM